MRKKDLSGEGNTLKVWPPPKALKKYPPPLMTRVEKKLSTQFMKNLHAPLPEGKKLKGLPPYQVVKKLHVPFWPESKKYPVRKKITRPHFRRGKNTCYISYKMCSHWSTYYKSPMHHSNCCPLPSALKNYPTPSWPGSKKTLDPFRSPGPPRRKFLGI